MTAQMLSPIRLTTRHLTVARAAAGVAAGGEACPAARPGRPTSGFRIQRMPEVVGKRTAFGGRSIRLDRLSAKGRDSWYGQDDSVQAGGTDPGP